MKNKTTIMILIILVLAIVLGIMIKFAFFPNSSTTSDIVEITETSQEVETITTESYSDYTAKIYLSNLSLSGSGVTISNNTITIVSSGTYYFSGTLNNGNIVVNAKDQEVVLVFENANITSSNIAVINVLKAEKVTINLVEGSVNTFTDGSTYTEFTDEDEPNATIFSKSDLYITGTGTLKVNANYQDAIASKDKLVIAGGNIQITANDEALRGKDLVNISNANITINSKGKGIKSETEITINSGNIKVTSTNDCLHSNGYIIINGGTLELSSGDDGIHADTNILIEDGIINISKSYEGIEANYIKINGRAIRVIPVFAFFVILFFIYISFFCN